MTAASDHRRSSTPRWVLAARRVLLTVAFLILVGCPPNDDGRPPRTTEIWAWGSNNFGQVGDNTNTDRPTPVKLAGLNDVERIRAGNEFSLALRYDGTVWRWGRMYAQMAAATTRPVRVDGLSDVRTIGTGERHALAILNNGTLRGWGANNAGQLAVPVTPSRADEALVPTQPTADPGNFLAVTGGDRHTLAVRSGTPVMVPYAWGMGPIIVSTPDTCQPAAVSLPCRLTPAQIPNLQEIIGIAAGKTHSVVLKSNGTVWTWGSNDRSQLGVSAASAITQTSTPQQVVESHPSLVPLSGIKDIAAGAHHTLALASDGHVWTWGSNEFGQRGEDWSNFSQAHLSGAWRVEGPNGVGFLSDVVAIAAGANHSLAITSDGGVWAWGDNRSGQLGASTTPGCNWGQVPRPCSPWPIRILTLQGATDVAAGERHSLLRVRLP